MPLPKGPRNEEYVAQAAAKQRSLTELWSRMREACDFHSRQKDVPADKFAGLGARISEEPMPLPVPLLAKKRQSSDVLTQAQDNQLEWAHEEITFQARLLTKREGQLLNPQRSATPPPPEPELKPEPGTQPDRRVPFVVKAKNLPILHAMFTATSDANHAKLSYDWKKLVAAFGDCKLTCKPRGGSVHKFSKNDDGPCDKMSFNVHKRHPDGRLYMWQLRYIGNLLHDLYELGPESFVAAED
ncbi:hypothetical protein MBLNU230_g7613t1 [Neophaeotheca triangularis]